MKNKISMEYAKALFEISCEMNACDLYYNELKMLESVFKDAREYVELLSSSAISVQERMGAIENALSGRINDDIVSFLKLLCRVSRIGAFFDCVRDFEELYNKAKGIVVVNVTSARELSDSEREKLRLALEKKYARRVRLSYKSDKDILGGIIVEAENTIIDGSLRTRLREMREVIGRESKKRGN